MDIGKIEKVIEIERIDESLPAPDCAPAPALDPDASCIRIPYTSAAPGLQDFGADLADSLSVVGLQKGPAPE